MGVTPQYDPVIKKEVLGGELQMIELWLRDFQVVRKLLNIDI